MTHQLNVARGRDVVTRWCALAERRLEYLTELFETGRWRRFHSELDFLENIQEAKAAVALWRDLSSREASRNNNAIDLSWLSRPRTKLPPVEGLPAIVHRPKPAAIPAEPPRSIISIVPKADPAPLEEAPVTPVSDRSWEFTRDITAAITERYPLLRNAL
jgi:uncharacterized repeat protein (TIGR03809 family)